MATGTPPPSAKQPKILQARALRTLFYVLIIGAMLFGVKWYTENRNDISGSLAAKSDTTGMIAAVEVLNEGQKVVAFDAKGTKLEPAGYKDGSTERDAVWEPDGNRLFFVSDRAGQGFQLYRWVPGSNAEPDLRSLGSLGKSNPSFPAQPSADANDTMLMISGGYVLEFDPKNQKAHQVLPPLTGQEVTQVTDEEGGSGGQASQFSQLYSQIGDSFRMARWCADKQAVAAIMRRDRGEVLIVQPLPQGSEPLQKPIVLIMAEHIDFDVSKKDGSVVFAAQGMILPDEVARALQKSGQKGKLVQHRLGIYKPGDPGPRAIADSANDAQCFAWPTFSPTGDKVLLCGGSFDPSSATFSPVALLTVPLDGQQGARFSVVLQAPVYEPSWSSTGEEIAYVKKSAGGKRAIFVVKPDGFGERNVTGETGDYAKPIFSPQTKSG